MADGFFSSEMVVAGSSKFFSGGGSVGQAVLNEFGGGGENLSRESR